MKTNLVLLFFIILIPVKLFAITDAALKKYPYQLLTEDYGILNEANLKRFTYEMNVEPFNWEITGLDYWQCFPTKNVSVYYTKDSYDPDTKQVLGDAHISIKVSENVVHEYEMRRNFQIDYAIEKVKRWKQLMKNEAYVCTGGAYAGSHEKLRDRRQIIEHGWVFDNLKTKKGCDSYFSVGCS